MSRVRSGRGIATRAALLTGLVVALAGLAVSWLAFAALGLVPAQAIPEQDAAGEAHEQESAGEAHEQALGGDELACLDPADALAYPQPDVVLCVTEDRASYGNGRDMLRSPSPRGDSNVHYDRLRRGG